MTNDDNLVSDGPTAIYDGGVVRFRIGWFPFSENGRNDIKKEPLGCNWPVVYLIHNNEYLYIGETCDMSNRLSQHLKNQDRGDLSDVEVIFSREFNKSASLDVEQSLIQLCGADAKYKLQNLNTGQSPKHDYYLREWYNNSVEKIWGNLRKIGLAKNGYHSLVNSDLFKYSPYITLTDEQNDICVSVITDILEKLTDEHDDSNGVSLISGSAGTGKTIMAINMIFSIMRSVNEKKDLSETTYGFSDEQTAMHELRELREKKGEIRVGFVIPMQSIRKTIKKVFSKTNGLRSDMVIGPSDVVDRDGNGRYDVLFVDEAHRLSQRKNICNMGGFDTTCRSMGLDPKKSTQLDWIMRSAECKILFYDSDQSVKGSDITQDQFEDTIGDIPEERRYRLRTQMRCRAGDDYPQYLKDIFEGRCNAEDFKKCVEGYDLQLFDDVDRMVNEIKILDKEHNLCRNVAGYSWKWATKGKKKDEIEREGLSDIDIDGHRYVWNMSNVEWILREDSVNEIGCIHTTQGYDLNYVGVIFGEEIDYDSEKHCVTIDRSKFFDTNVKKSTSDEDLKRYIVNAYRVMMLRGIKGCYVYACNPGLREYLGQFINQKLGGS